MNWDQQLIEACTETDGTIHPHTDHVLTGAKWMREQLRTNEAVERVAREIWKDSYWREKDLFEDESEVMHKLYDGWARSAITALLGEH